MGAYQYQALAKSGRTKKGVIEADSERNARHFLRKQGLIPTHIHPITKQSATTTKKISSQELTLLTRQLATLIAAGIPLEEALVGVSEQADKETIRSLVMGVRSKILEGYALAQALEEFPSIFPELYRATIRAGEQTGRLDTVLQKLANYTEDQQKIKQKIQQALIYPILMIIVSLSIISFLLAFVVPKIIDVFTTSNQSLPEITKILIFLSDLLKSYGLISFAVFIGLIFAFKKSLSHKKIKWNWHKIILKLPLASYLIKSVNVARYTYTFGVLFAAGVNVVDTMRVSASLVNNLVMRNAFDRATTRVSEGIAIHQALKETGFINPMALHLIASGEKGGQVAPMMEKTATHLDDELKHLIDTSLTLLEPLIILFMGAIVLFIVLAILLPIFSMEQLVT